MLDDLKARTCEANLLLPKYGLVDLTFGNLSIIDRGVGIIAIKPSGVPYERMMPDDIVLVDTAGRKEEGDLSPSSDTLTHVRLYRAFPSIGAVAHTHSKYATSFAQAGLAVECYGTTHADYFNGEIPITRAMRDSEIENDYESETGNVIAERFRDISPEDRPGVLVRSHGPFAWGSDGLKAAEHAFAIELLAEMAFLCRQLNPAMERVEGSLLDKHFGRKHGIDAYYGQP